MYQWSRMFAEAFPIGTVLLFIVVFGGGYFFKDEIRDFIKDRTRKSQEIHQPSMPAAKRAQYSPGKVNVVYTVSQEDNRMLLI